MRRSISCVLVIALAMVFVAMFGGCASTSSMKWTPAELNGLKGKTMEEISSVYGQPSQRYSANDGRQVWEYRKESQNRLNTLFTITTFGIVGGENNFYVDVLRIYFSNDRVVQTNLDENVVGYLTQSGATIQPRQEAAAPRQESVAPRQERIASRHEDSVARQSVNTNNKSDRCECVCSCYEQPVPTTTTKKKRKSK